MKKKGKPSRPVGLTPEYQGKRSKFGGSVISEAQKKGWGKKDVFDGGGVLKTRSRVPGVSSQSKRGNIRRGNRNVKKSDAKD